MSRRGRFLPMPEGCFQNTDPFILPVTAFSPATTVSAPALSITGLTLISRLPAAAAAIFPGRSQRQAK